MPRRSSLIVVFVPAACEAPEPLAPPSEAARPSLDARAGITCVEAGGAGEGLRRYATSDRCN